MTGELVSIPSTRRPIPAQATPADPSGSRRMRWRRMGSLALTALSLVLATATSADRAAAQSAAKTATAQAPASRTANAEASGEAVELESGFSWLFDGKTLTGWEGKERWFRVEEGAIVAGSLQEKIPNNEFLCTRQTYDDFELRLQVRLKGEGNNAGVQFRSSRVPNDHEVSGYQCDVGAAFGRSVWGALYDESRRNKMLAEGPAADVAKWTKVGQWNDLAVRCQGDRVQLWLNGHATVDYRESDPQVARSGVIGLQIHSGPPTEAWYRAIRIRTLKKES